VKQSKLFLPTLRETPAEAEIASHKLMVRAGMMRQLASGVYTYLPLGYRVLRKVQQIVREEMDKAGAQEIVMPAIQPAELWKETGRWEAYGPELMRLKDRHNRDFVLGPTHEEVVTSLVRDNLNTYKKLPINLYQIQTKYRDEVRPRFGVIRSREFIMKDAYSFDTDREGLDVSYQSMYNAYSNIFSRAGLKFRAVEADAGAIGGKGTHEFMALSEIGEDTIAYCTSCNYAANLEQAEVVYNPDGNKKDAAEMEKVATPDVKTIAQLMNHFDAEAREFIKAIVFRADDRFVMALVRGDHEVNDIKVKNLVDANVLEMATDKEIADLGLPLGFIGPVGLPKGIEVIADTVVRDSVNAACGANEKDFHYMNATPGKDFQVSQYADLRNVVEGDECPRCGGHIAFARGIEVGHVFKLGTRYSEKMGAKFLDQNGKEQLMVMGCYGIGISRTVAACVEQNNDGDGIVWPWGLAPYQIHVVPVNVKNEDQRNLADSIYESLHKAGYEVLLDDRSERAGVKFKDADLIGLPVRITVGGKAGEGFVECKIRKTGETQEIHIDSLPDFVAEIKKSLQ
jgi:prolyl-tRNA synthetase